MRSRNVAFSPISQPRPQTAKMPRAKAALRCRCGAPTAATWAWFKSPAHGVRGFTDEDQAVLEQLGHMASIAVENVLLAREREASQLKDEFLATLSHELRTPLNSILGWTHILAAQSSKNRSGSRRRPSVIERSVLAQNRLIEDLLGRVANLARRSAPRSPSRRPATACCKQRSRPRRPTANSREIELSLESRTRTPCGRGRRRSAAAGVRQLAVQRAEVHASRRACQGPSASPKRRSGSGRVDDGEGIEASFLPLVFERFRQGNHGSTRRFSGLGIGLTIVKHLVEAHGGRIAVASDGPNRGTTVTVTIPIARPVGASELAARPRLVGVGTNLAGLRILVVDDQEDARDVAARILRGAGAEVVSASSVHEAFRSIDRDLPDLVISDLAMPEQSGFALIKRLRSLAPPRGSVPAMALSALVGPSERAQALAAGFQVHAGKPCDPNYLLSLAAMLTADRQRSQRAT